jgi:hypothetical protein
LYQFEILNKIPIENHQLKNCFLTQNFEIGGGAVLLLWANTFSPFGERNMSEDYTKDGERRGVTARDE